MSRSTALPAHRLAHTPLTASSRPSGALPFLNPTRATLTHPSSPHALLWRSRDNRKGRHTLAPSSTGPPPTNRPRAIVHGVARMLTRAPVYDVSWLVAVAFTVGSVVWCVNAFFVYLPLVRPRSAFGAETDAGDWTAFVGATVFEVGSVLLMWEAVNENHTACFGWAIVKTLEGEGEEGGVRPDREGCRHHHHRRFRARGEDSAKAAQNQKISLNGSSNGEDVPQWMWWPSWEYLHTHLLHEVGFLASLSQFIGATIFWISGFTVLPNVLDQNNTGLLDGIFWTPQVVGGIGFIVSGILFMLETQPNWYTPAFGTIGWHVGFWNLVGAVGFTLCGALGYSSGSGEQYQSALATFWGSWAFLIASVAQWYEAVNKFPVKKAA